MRLEFLSVGGGSIRAPEPRFSQFITKPAGLDQILAMGKVIKDLVMGPIAG